MRRFTLLLILALLSTAFLNAQQPLNSNSQLRFRNLNQRLAPSADGTLACKPAGSLPIKAASPRVKKLPDNPGQLISSQPQGTLLESMQRSSHGYYSYWGYAIPQTDASRIATVVVADDAIYILNPFSTINTASWLKLDKQADGTYLARPQTIYVQTDTYGDGSTYTYYAERLVPSADSTGYVEDSTANPDYSIKFKYEDNVLSQVDNGGDILGMVDSDGLWVGYGEWNLLVCPMTETVPPVPEAVKTAATDYLMTYNTSETATDRTLISIARDGDTFYFNNPYNRDPQSWFKGTLADGKVSIANRQYLGPDTVAGYYLYLMTADSAKAYDEEWDEYYTVYNMNAGITLDYDASANTFQASDTKFTFVVNAGDDQIFNTANYLNARIEPYVKPHERPDAPTYTNYSFEADPESGQNFISFALKETDLNGTYIDPSLLTYRLWLKDAGGEAEVFTFYPDTYKDLKTEMTEIPFNFTSYDIAAPSALARIVYLYEDVSESEIGLQELYQYSPTEELESDITWLNVKEANAINTANAGKGITSVALYDTSGRKMSVLPVHGIFIEKTTYADGSCTTRKIGK